MNLDVTKAFAYLVAAAILIGTYYALIVYPYQLDADVKLWLTGLSGAASGFIFGDQVASRTARQTNAAISTGLGATPNESVPTVTATTGPPATVTVSPAETPSEPVPQG
jgi:hypothetical protein